MIKTKKIKIIMLIITIIIILVSVFEYRFYTRKVLDVSVLNINVEKNYGPDSAMNEQQKKAMESNPHNYACIEYILNVSNKSKFYVDCIHIQPEAYGDMKNKVFWFDYTDALTDDPLGVDPKSYSTFGRNIIIKRDALSDEELAKVAKSIKFELTYYTYPNKSESLLGMGYNSQVFDYKEK